MISAGPLFLNWKVIEKVRQFARAMRSGRRLHEGLAGQCRLAAPSFVHEAPQLARDFLG